MDFVAYWVVSSFFAWLLNNLSSNLSSTGLVLVYHEIDQVQSHFWHLNMFTLVNDLTFDYHMFQHCHKIKAWLSAIYCVLCIAAIIILKMLKHYQHVSSPWLINCHVYTTWFHINMCQLTSKTPRHLPSLPMTPASSSTSRIAVTEGSSSGSTPPPGTIQLSGRLEDVTRSTYTTQRQTHELYKLSTSQTPLQQQKYNANLCFGVRTNADTRRATSISLVVVDPNRIRLLLHHFYIKHVNTN